MHAVEHRPIRSEASWQPIDCAALIPGSDTSCTCHACLRSRGTLARRRRREPDSHRRRQLPGHLWSPAKGVYPLGYVPHNPHLLWFAPAWKGRAEKVARRRHKTAQRVNLPDLMRQPALLDDALVRRCTARGTRSGWRRNFAPDLPYVTAIWNYAQAMAAIGRAGWRTQIPIKRTFEAGRRSDHDDLDNLGSLSAWRTHHRVGGARGESELALARGDRAPPR